MDMQDDIRNAVEAMRGGGVILYPTDTVWGIGCDATNPEAVARVYAIKGREESKGMICLVDSAARLQRFVRNAPEVALQVMELATRPTTVIFDNPSGLAANLLAQDGSVAMRITGEEFSRQLCYRLQRPVVSTSANLSGERPARSFREIPEELLGAVDYVCRSRRKERPQGTPSSVIRVGCNGEIAIIRN